MTNSNAPTVSRKAFPVSADLAELVLRVAFGVTMAVLHGWEKAAALFAGDGAQFPSVLGLPPLLSSALAVLAEVVAALLVAVGLLTRMSAAYLSVFFIVAVVVMHGGALAGEQGGEFAFLYLSAFAAITLAGPGCLQCRQSAPATPERGLTNGRGVAAPSELDGSDRRSTPTARRSRKSQTAAA